MIWWIIFAVFLALKLAGVIAWSWWLVFAPLLIPAAIIILFFAGLGGVCAVAFKKIRR